MPELPEVELARRLVEAECMGRRIARVTLQRASFVHKQSDDLAGAMMGAQIVGAARHGKSLAIQLDRDGGERWWMIHLGMSGRLRWDAGADDTAPAHPHERFTLALSGGGALRHVDMRMLGYVAVGAPEAMRALAKWANLGPDALDVPSADALRDALLTKRGRPAIKVALMDQARLAGLGNIQVTEALFRAGVHPARPVASLGSEEWQKLWLGIRASIDHTLEQTDAHNVVYVQEGAPNPFLVYGRESQECSACAHPIARIVQHGRTTFLCERCQT